MELSNRSSLVQFLAHSITHNGKKGEKGYEKTFLTAAKRSMTGFLAAALCFTSMPSSGLRNVFASSLAERDNPSIVYFVDCGDHIVNTVSGDDQLGTHNSVTDQVYGKDAVTGYEWGVVDTVSTPLSNGSTDGGGVFTDHTWAFEQAYKGADAPDATGTNRYTKNQYEQGIQVRYIDYEFEVEAGTYRVETYTADPWGCSKAPTLLLNSEAPTADYQAGKGTKITPKTVVKQNVTMDKAGKLKVSFRADGGNNLAINVCYIKIVDTSQEKPDLMVERDMNLVSFSNTKLTEDISLPVKGKNGSTISWKSSNDKVLTSSGDVTRPSIKDGDTYVTLTATFTYNDVVKTKDYTFLVVAEDPEEVVDRDILNVSFPNTFLTENLTLPTSGEGGTKISWKSSNEAACSSAGVINRPAAGASDVDVILTAVYSYNGVEKSKDYPFVVAAQTENKDRKTFSLDDVKITDGYYLSAQTSDVEFLKKFDADRILSRFRETAGLDTKGKQPYNGWENSLIGGHCVGHYLTAAAQAVMVTKDAELKAKLDYIITELKKCQDALGTGFIFGAEVRDTNNVERQFDVVEGKLSGNAPNASGKNMNDTWVPWYTMHKIVQGLVDVYRYADNEEALTVADALGTWVYNRTSKWTQDENNRILWSEYGGMNDCLYELYKYTKNQKHMDAAHKFDYPSLYQSVTSGAGDTLKGRHANATIPKFLGGLNRYVTLKENGIAMTKEDEAYLGYMEKFFDIVTKKHAFITGGTSVMEHFRDDNAQDAIRTQTNCESCCAHNMLRMARELFRLTGEKKYADYYEDTIRNAIMGSINTDNGSTMYFVPMATGYYKVFSNSNPDQNMFWCCTGTGMENFTKLGDSIYFHTDDSLIVNQYVASEVTWNDKKVKVVQESDVTKSDKAKFTVHLLEGNSASMTLSFHVPDWVSAAPSVTVNGTLTDAKSSGGFISINRSWAEGDTVEVTLPMTVKAYGLPDNSSVYGFKYGPTVLAAKLGKDEMGKEVWAGANLTAPEYKVVGPEKASIRLGYGEVTRQILGTETLVVSDTQLSVEDFFSNIDQYLVKEENADGLSFHLAETDADTTFTNGLTFVPFNTLNSERYGIYWYFQDQKSNNSEDKLLEEKEEGRFTNSILDSIQPGYQQYENDAVHQMSENNSVAGTITDGGSTRYAKAGGSFSYNMLVNTNKTNYVLCQFAKEDNGKTIKITVGDRVIAGEKLDNKDNSAFYKKYYEIPADVLKAAKFSLDTGKGMADAVRVKFESNDAADSARLVGGLYMTANYNNDASITSLTSNVGEVKKADTNYTITVPKGTAGVSLTISIADKAGLLYMDGQLVNDTKPQSVVLNEDEKKVELVVYAEDHTTNATYTVTIQRETGSDPQTEDKTDKTALDNSIKAAEAMLSKLTGADKEALQKAINTAKAAAEKEGATQADIDAALKAMKAAKDTAQKVIDEGKVNPQPGDKADTTALNDSIKAAEELLSKLTGSDQEALEKAIAAAKEAAGKEGATQADIDAALAEILAAKATAQKIVDAKKEEVKPTPKPAVNYVGKIFTLKSGMKFKITACSDKKKTVTVMGTKKDIKSITIPATAKYKKMTFKVTAVNKAAFKNQKKATKAIIGKNVTAIGVNAFNGCKKLGTVKVNSSAIKTIGKNAFGKVKKNVSFKVPKAKKAAYKKLLKKAKTKNYKMK